MPCVCIPKGEHFISKVYLKSGIGPYTSWYRHTALWRLFPWHFTACTLYSVNFTLSWAEVTLYSIAWYFVALHMVTLLSAALQRGTRRLEGLYWRSWLHPCNLFPVWRTFLHCVALRQLWRWCNLFPASLKNFSPATIWKVFPVRSKTFASPSKNSQIGILCKY